MTGSKQDFIARRAAQEVQAGFYVNLGIGLPSLLFRSVPFGADVCLLSENGLLGVKALPPDSRVEPNLVNARREPVGLASGASSFSCVDAFAMIRGGHLDLAILEAMEVDDKGNFANWMIPGQMVKGMGAAMDLAVGAKRLIVLMEHTTPEGRPRLLRHCTLPLTGIGVVKRIITEMAVVDVSPSGLILKEIASELTVDEVRRQTEAELIVDKDLQVIQI